MDSSVAKRFSNINHTSTCRYRTQGDERDMSITSDLRRQHGNILRLISEIESNLTPETLKQNADTTIAVLSELSRQLVIHLALEDKGLLPLLIARHTETARRMTLAFMEEWGNFAGDFKAYIMKWDSAELIKEKASEFCEETRVMFYILQARIQCEENDIFPLEKSL